MSLNQKVHDLDLICTLLSAARANEKDPVRKEELRRTSDIVYNSMCALSGYVLTVDNKLVIGDFDKSEAELAVSNVLLSVEDLDFILVVLKKVGTFLANQEEASKTLIGKRGLEILIPITNSIQAAVHAVTRVKKITKDEIKEAKRAENLKIEQALADVPKQNKGTNQKITVN